MTAATGGKIHRYRSRCEWRGSTGSGYESYDRSHLGWAPPATAQLALSADAAFRGSPGSLNPEQLVVMAASSCQLLSFLAVAARSRIDVRAYMDEAVATMPADAGRIVSIELRPVITVGSPTADSRLERAVHLAHEECFIARSLACPVTVEPTFQLDP